MPAATPGAGRGGAGLHPTSATKFSLHKATVSQGTGTPRGKGAAPVCLAGLGQAAGEVGEPWRPVERRDTARGAAGRGDG